MKRFTLLTIFSTMSLLLLAQNNIKGIMKDSVVIVEGVSSDEIYNSIIAWTKNLGQTVRDHDIIDIRNVGQHNLQGKFTTNMSFSGAKWVGFSGPLSWSWDIRVKEGKFRIRMYDYFLDNPYIDGHIYTDIPEGSGLIQRKGYPHIYPIIWEFIDDTFKALVYGLHEAILNDKKVFGDDDW